MTELGDATLMRTQDQKSGVPQHDNMIFVPGGTFRMGSDRHYPEEAPVHRVTVDGFWIDRTPVTNRQFKRVRHERPATSPSPKSRPIRRTIPARCRT